MEKARYWDETLSFEERARDLVSHMTLEEAASSWESAVDIDAASIAESSMPEISAGKMARVIWMNTVAESLISMMPLEDITRPTAPAATDIALAGSASVNYLSVANEEPIYDAENGTMSRVIRLTIQNGAAQQTITEWGVFNQLMQSTTSLYGVILLYRELLDVPVTLAPYDAATLALTLTLTLDDPL